MNNVYSDYENNKQPEKLGRGCGPLPKTLTLFMTKVSDFSYPTYELTKNSINYLGPACLINTLFQTCLIISSLVVKSI